MYEPNKVPVSLSLSFSLFLFLFLFLFLSLVDTGGKTENLHVTGHDV